MNAPATASSRRRDALRAAWQAQPPRQRTLVLLAAVLVAGALAWSIALGPALATLRTAPARHATLDAQLQRMQALQAQARALQAQPRLGRDEALRALEASLRTLGPGARLVPAGDSITVSLTNVPAPALAQWLAQARVDARAQASEARLTRQASGGWDGTVVLALPPR